MGNKQQMETAERSFL